MVAFEVDDVDSGTGWTVLVTGVVTAVRDVSTLVRLDQLGLVAWAGADRQRWVKITLADVSGRSVAVTADDPGSDPVTAVAAAAV